MQRFLIVVRAEDKQPIAPRIIIEAKAILSRFSPHKAELAFNSPDACVVAFTIKSEKAAAQVRAALEPLVLTKSHGFLFVLSLSDDFSAIGNSSGWRHFQH